MKNIDLNTIILIFLLVFCIFIFVRANMNTGPIKHNSGNSKVIVINKDLAKQRVIEIMNNTSPGEKVNKQKIK